MVRSEQRSEDYVVILREPLVDRKALVERARGAGLLVEAQALQRLQRLEARLCAANAVYRDIPGGSAKRARAAIEELGWSRETRGGNGAGRWDVDLGSFTRMIDLTRATQHAEMRNVGSVAPNEVISEEQVEIDYKELAVNLRAAGLVMGAWEVERLQRLEGRLRAAFAVYRYIPGDSVKRARAAMQELGWSSGTRGGTGTERWEIAWEFVRRMTVPASATLLTRGPIDEKVDPEEVVRELTLERESKSGRGDHDNTTLRILQEVRAVALRVLKHEEAVFARLLQRHPDLSPDVELKKLRTLARVLEENVPDRY